MATLTASISSFIIRCVAAYIRNCSRLWIEVCEGVYGLMPVYDYRCPECGNRFERLVRFSELNDPVNCPTCGSLRSIKLLSPFAVVGTGHSDANDCAPTGG